GRNRGAVGARLQITTIGGKQSRTVTTGSAYLSNSSLVQHFGLGAATVVDALEVVWPSGQRTRLEHLPADRRYAIIEGQDMTFVRAGTNPSRGARSRIPAWRPESVPHHPRDTNGV